MGMSEDLKGEKGGIHVADGGLDTGVPDLDGDDGVELSDCGLEGDEERVFVGEDSEEAVLYSHGDAGGEGFFVGHEPVFLLGGLVWRR